MTKWLARIFWTAVGCALVALAAARGAELVLQQFPERVADRINAELAKHIPGAQLQFAGAQVGFSPRGFVGAQVNDLLLQSGGAKIFAPRADLWLQNNGLALRLHSPDIAFAPTRPTPTHPAPTRPTNNIVPDDGVSQNNNGDSQNTSANDSASGDVFLKNNSAPPAPLLALGGFRIVAANNAVVRLPSSEWGGATLRAVNLTAARRDNGNLLLHLENREPEQNFSLQAEARPDLQIALRAAVDEWSPPPAFPVRWDGDASADLWAEVDLQKQQWRIAVDAKGESVAAANFGTVANLSVRAVASGSGSETRSAVVVANGVGVGSDIASAGALSVRAFVKRNGESFVATVFVRGDELKAPEFGDAKRFAARAVVSQNNGTQSANVLANGESAESRFGDAASVWIRAEVDEKQNGEWRMNIATRAADVFSPVAGAAAFAEMTAAFSGEPESLRGNFAAALSEAEVALLPAESPPLRTLRARGDFVRNASGAWEMNVPQAEAINSSSRRSSVGTHESDAPASVVSSFPAQAGTHSDPGRKNDSRFRGKGIEPAAGAAESSVPTLERRDEYLIMSLFASSESGAPDDWRINGSAENINAADIWRYLPDGDVREWFRESLPEGILSRAKFRGEKNLPPELSGVFENARIVVDEGWPDAENLSGALSFADNKLDIRGEGVFDGLPVADVVATIPDVFADAATLFLEMRPSPQPLSRYLQTALDLPDGESYRAALSSYEMSGRGALSVAAVVPLDENIPNTFAAKLNIADGRFVDLQTPKAPPLESASGEVVINDNDARGKLRGMIRGAAAVLDFDSGGDFTLRAKMNAREAMAVAEVNFPLRGALAFTLSRRGGLTLFASDLRETALDLPPPLRKESGTAAWLQAQVENGETELVLRVDETEVNAALFGDDRGAIGLNAPVPEAPSRGFRASGTMNGAELGEWLSPVFSGDDSPGRAWVLDLTLTNAEWSGRTVSEMIVSVPEADAPLSVFANAPDFRGGAFIDFAAGSGNVSLAFVNLPGDSDDDSDTSLTLSGESRNPFPGSESEVGSGFRRKGIEKGIDSDSETDSQFAFPVPSGDLELTITIVDIRRDGKSLGSFAGMVRGDSESWRLNDGAMRMGANVLSASAEFSMRDSGTGMSLMLSAPDLPDLMERLNLGGFVERGALTVSGKLRWPSPPTDLGFANMSGGLRVDAEDVAYRGESAGAVKGVVNFLSVFSPLSLLTLGFLKATQSGTALDRLGCDAVIENGVAKFPSVTIENEDVVINMSGETDLVNRRHDLRGEVKPGSRILKAVGPALAATGQLPALAVVEVLRRVFAKPLSNLGAYEYAIRGSWDDPQYEEKAPGESDDAEGE